MLTEPDASRTPRIIGCIRCSEDRGGSGSVHHASAAGNYRYFSPVLIVLTRKSSFRFSSDTLYIPRAVRGTVNAKSFFSPVPRSYRLIDDACFHELNPLPSPPSSSLSSKSHNPIEEAEFGRVSRAKRGRR